MGWLTSWFACDPCTGSEQLHVTGKSLSTGKAPHTPTGAMAQHGADSVGSESVKYSVNYGKASNI